VKRLFAFVAMLLTSACCTSLPRVSGKRIDLPPFSPASGVRESSEVWRDEARRRDVPVRIYAPAATPTSTPAPVVIFSHGIGEDRDSYVWLGQALARHGFLAVHITHAGTDRAMLERGYRYLYRATKDPRNWIARPLDVTFVLDRLASRGDADLSRVAVAGHSAGAFTAFAAGGVKLAAGGDFRHSRVKAIISMSMPRLEGVVAEGGYDAVTIPTLHMTGTCDTSLIWRTFPRHRRIPFESSSRTGQYLLTFQGVTHDTFSAREERHHAEIARATIAFLRAFLLNDSAARAWFDEAATAEALTLERK
jgi:pimeloyl-ACP methyl ester carboxylesterase